MPPLGRDPDLVEERVGEDLLEERLRHRGVLAVDPLEGGVHRELAPRRRPHDMHEVILDRDCSSRSSATALSLPEDASYGDLLRALDEMKVLPPLHLSQEAGSAEATNPE